MKFFTRLFLPLLTCWLCMLPGLATAGAISTIRVGGTFYPVTAQGALGAATDIALLAGRATPWVAGLSLAYQIGKFALEGLDSSGAVVPLNVLPANVAQLPATTSSWTGWTYNSTTKTWSPPATAMPVPTYCVPVNSWCASTTRTTRQESCSVVDGYWPSNAPYMAVDTGGTYGQGFCDSPVPGATDPALKVAGSACPSGYTLSGSVCNLSNPSLVPYPSDNAPTVIAKADGTGFALDTRDPDGALAPTTIPNVLQGTGTVNGNQMRVTIEPQTGGGLKVTTEQQVMNSDGSMTTYKQSVVTGPDGKVTNTTAANYPGGLQDQTTQTPALSPSTGDVSAVVDELKAQQAAAEAAKNAYQNPSGASPSIVDLNIPTSNPYDSALPAAVAGLPLPANDGGCYALEVSLPYMGVMSISPCAIVNVVRPLVNWMIVSIGVIGGILVWLRSDEVTA